jgi:hypothetical protein
MDQLTVWSQVRPEAWWGVTALWQFWLALAATGAFVSSIICDIRR